MQFVQIDNRLKFIDLERFLEEEIATEKDAVMHGTLRTFCILALLHNIHS